MTTTTIPIFLSSDNNYAPFVATTIASICDNTKFFCNFYILDGGISNENQEKICILKKQFSNFSIEFIKIDPQIYFKDIEYKNSCAYVSISTYNRFLIPKIKPLLKKVLYLDVDIIVCGDIFELYKIDLENYFIAACMDNGSDVNYLNYLKTNLGLSQQSKYFNAGVLLINSERWLKEDISSKLFDIEKTMREKLLMADQDVLNTYFENKYLLLDNKYNAINYSNDILIRHFAGLIKPWQADFCLENRIPKPLQNRELFWKYAKKTLFYDIFVKMKEDFLNSNVLYKRFNKIVNGV